MIVLMTTILETIVLMTTIIETTVLMKTIAMTTILMTNPNFACLNKLMTLNQKACVNNSIQV
jgi:hypothetical protein